MHEFRQAVYSRDLTPQWWLMQAVHSGDDLTSAAQRVLGFRSRSRKGKEVEVEPIPQLATPLLRQLLAALEAAQAAVARVPDASEVLRTLFASGWLLSSQQSPSSHSAKAASGRSICIAHYFCRA